MVAKQFFNGITMNDIGKKVHVIKHSHRRCVVGAFDKNLHEGYNWTLPIEVLSLSYTNKYFFTFYITVQKFMKNIKIMMTEKMY